MTHRKLLPALTLLLLSNSQILAAPRAPDFQVAKEQGKSSFRLKATPPQGLHFNLKAPMTLDVSTGAKKSRLKPMKAAPDEVVFDLSSVEGFSAGTMSLYLCDDAN